MHSTKIYIGSVFERLAKISGQTRVIYSMMKTIFKAITLSLILISCHKNCPKPGDYQMTFTGTYEGGGASSSVISFITISETTEDSFLIGSTKIDKNGKEIIGEICCLNHYSWVKLDGECDKKNGVYYLTGTYQAADYGGGIINGEFEIKSK